MQDVKITAKEADGNLVITIKKAGICRLFRFFKEIFKRLGMFNDKILSF
jgi:hypothetical protein